MNEVINFVLAHETFFEVIFLLGGAAAFIHYVINTLIYEFICFAEIFNSKYAKNNPHLNHDGKVEVFSARLRRYGALLIAFSFTMH